MRVLQVSFRDLVGQRFNGYRLLQSLRAAGQPSRMLVVHKRSDDPDVLTFGRAGALLERGLYGLERVTSLQGMLSPFGWSAPMRRAVRDAQVVHWHLIHPHFVSLFAMPDLARMRPTIWTLHDPWPMTGHCVYPLECERWRTGCGHCPDLSRNFAVWFDTTALVWRTKRVAYRRTPLTLVVASRWMKERVEASPLLQSFPCQVIPFGLELDRWRPLDRAACRHRLGIPADATALAFRLPLGERQERIKGIPWLFEALRRLPAERPIHLIVLEGQGLPEDLRARYTIHELGWVDDEMRVAEALTAADLFLMPSAAESFGLMALEAMACGTPVVVSEGTALVDTVHAPEAGVAVRFGDAEALAGTIGSLLSDDSRRAALAARAREIVVSDHAYGDYVRRHVELYGSLIAAGPSDGR